MNTYIKSKEFFDIMKKAGRKNVQIQTFDDVKTRRKRALAANFAHAPQKIQEFIDQQAGIFWPINPQKSYKKRGYEHTIRYSGFGLDLDVAKEEDKTDKLKIQEGKEETLKKLESLEFPPAFCIETKNGLQPVWMFEAKDFESTKGRQAAIAEYKQLVKSFEIKTGLESEGDNIARVLRLPGSYHLKTPSDPFEIKFIEGTGELTDYTAFRDYYWVEPEPPKPTSFMWDSWTHDTNSIYDYPVVEALLKVSGTHLVNFETFDFIRERRGKRNIIIDGRSTGQFVNLENNTIGSASGDASVNIVRWCQWYHSEIGDRKMREELDVALDGEKARTKYSSQRVYALQKNKKDISLTELVDILSATIKEDDVTKVIVFLCYLLAYTNSSQINISLNAPSSAGKTHIVVEVSGLFPEEDLMKLSYASPTSFYHTGEYDEEREAQIVDLERKIIIFLDMPHPMLLEKLRGLLSHDEKETLIKITDRNKGNENRAKDIIIKGYCSVVFASANFTLDEQEQTRFLLLSPETSDKKAGQALEETIKRLSDVDSYKKDTQSKARDSLIERIRNIRDARVKEIILHDRGRINKYFSEKYSKAKPRHSRDAFRLISLVKVWALLNMGNRKIKDGVVTTNDTDYEVAFKLWDIVSLPQEYGISPYLLKVYTEIIWTMHQVKKEPLKRKEIQAAFFETYDKPLSYKKLSSEFLPIWETAGLISQTKDGREMLIEPLANLNSDQIHTPQGDNINVPKKPVKIQTSDSDEKFKQAEGDIYWEDDINDIWSCNVCGSKKYWTDPGGRNVCSMCHPKPGG